MAAVIRCIQNKTEQDRLLNRVFITPIRTGYVEVGKDNVCLPIDYKRYEERIRKFRIFEDDVFLTGFPKSGTTWCHELIWLIMHDLDFEAAKVSNLKRYRMLEMSTLYDFKKAGFEIDPMDEVENLERPRCIKTHLHWDLIPEEIRKASKQPKIIHIRRNPKDCCTSHYHQARLAAGFSGTFEEFCELYLAGRVPYGPYWKYAQSFWKERHRSNILMIRYEDMVADLPSVIKKIAQFLNKTVTDSDVEKLVQHLSFQSMKENPSLNKPLFFEEVSEKYKLNRGEKGFFRSGTVGNHKIAMSSEMETKFSSWIDENVAGTDYEL